MSRGAVRAALATRIAAQRTTDTLPSGATASSYATWTESAWRGDLWPDGQSLEGGVWEHGLFSVLATESQPYQGQTQLSPRRLATLQSSYRVGLAWRCRPDAVQTDLDAACDAESRLVDALRETWPGMHVHVRRIIGPTQLHAPVSLTEIYLDVIHEY